MQIGFIGAGNMATALARGWGDPVLVHDAYRPRAEALVEELGGEVLESAAEVAQRADVVLLCHKPQGLERVANAIGGAADAVVSILGGVTVGALRAAYGATPVVRIIPSVPVEVRQGVSCHARDDEGDPQLTAQAIALFERVGLVVTVDEAQMGIATGLMSCAPAYIALVAEAQVDAGVRAGLPADVAGELVAANIGGTAALLQARGMDTLAVRRAVTSPGGITARGLAALEHGGIRAAFDDAMQAVLAR
ncbi:MAG: pyrroline-5-carboxylate reductase, partial [Solirubrobacteraceae bacterium]|jgi:pyrroline-5-carboxylate reductase|nr:pyrroline-5-carboxylate reductase [Solirubrobacteraceae bacterium]